MYFKQIKKEEIISIYPRSNTSFVGDPMPF